MSVAASRVPFFRRFPCMRRVRSCNHGETIVTVYWAEGRFLPSRAVSKSCSARRVPVYVQPARQDPVNAYLECLG